MRGKRRPDLARLLECVQRAAKHGRAVSTSEAGGWLSHRVRRFRCAGAGLAELRRQGHVVSLSQREAMVNFGGDTTRVGQTYWTTPLEVAT